MSISSSHLPAAVAISLLITACGGGGGGGSVDRGNQPPLADAGLPQTVTSAELVLLDASASRDPDGSVVGYRWQQSSGPTVQLDDSNAVQSSFLAPTVSAPTALVFTLNVTDNAGATSTDSVTITVAAPAPGTRFSIAGVISASDSQAVDGDTNDPANEYIPNDELESAQPIANPITLGGYVNKPGTGASGRSQLPGDIDDYFRVELLAGQSVTMLVADFQEADADLYLYDTEGEVVASSIESGEIETIVIPRDGIYVVNAFAHDGATNYILAVGNQNIAASKSKRHYDIVPWQTVVKYREAGDKAGKTTAPRQDIARRLGMEQQAGGPGRGRLLALRRDAATQAQEIERLGSARGKKDHIKDPELRARWETLIAIKSLRRDPQIEYAEPNYRVKALAVPDDEAYPFQWHYPLINLPAAWDNTTGSPEVTVAVVDTGILSGHPDLAGQTVAGYDFVRDRDNALDGDGIDPDPEDPGEPGDDASNSFHGSHVSGTVAAAGNNGLGVAGVAYSARIMPLRALGGDGSGTSYDVNQAIRFAAGLANDSGTLPPQKADIINLSLGGGPFTQSDQNLFNQVRAAGVMVVAAAGNEASSQPAYPASYQGVISVSAVDAQRRVTGYSNTGSFVDLAAPGGNNGEDFNGDGYPDGVLSTAGSGAGSSIRFVYSFLAGTSMASPHVAGVLALMKSANPDLSPDDIDALLIRGELSDDLGAPGRDDDFGYGLINAQRAVLAALEASGKPPADDPLLSASASTLNFSSTRDALELELGNDGKGELELLELSESAPWLTLIPESVDDNGLGIYRVVVNRDQVASGVYAADITARSSVNTLVIRVVMSVGGEGATADVGIIYILLIDADSGEVVAQVAPGSEQGRYSFEFTDVPQGRYTISAGSDADNDLFICDAGEACGAWLTTDQPLLIELDANREDINFPVEYLVSFPNSAGVDQSASGFDQPLPVARKGRGVY